MEQEKETESVIPEEIKDIEQIRMLDFLYIDKERVDSFVSQMHEGTLRSVKRTNDTTQGSSLSKDEQITKKFEGSIHVMKGSGEQTKKNSQLDNALRRNAMEEQFDPYHSQLLNLLNDLSLPTAHKVPPAHTTAKLMLFKSKISIKNFGSLSKIFPIISKHGKTFGINKITAQNFSAMEDLLRLAPLSTDIELQLKDNSKITGQIKDSCLLLNSEDILRSYGSKLPGNWYILGIVDHIEKDDNEYQKNSKDFLSGVDMFIESIKDIYSPSEFRISPILIYRIIES